MNCEWGNLGSWIIKVDATHANIPDLRIQQMSRVGVDDREVTAPCVYNRQHLDFMLFILEAQPKMLRHPRGGQRVGVEEALGHAAVSFCLYPSD
jgi:hypothetical protein